MIPWIQALLAVGISAVAAYTDKRTGKIPNSLCFMGMGSGLVLGLAGAGLHGLLIALAGGFAAGLVPLILFRMDAMGGGDVKLFFAVGSLLGIGAALEIEMMSFVIGALWGMGIWIRQRQFIAGLKGVLVFAVPYLGKRLLPEGSVVSKTEIKFAPAIFAAVLIIVARTAAGLL
jgi:prepilin peptidase CpaA